MLWYYNLQLSRKLTYVELCSLTMTESSVQFSSFQSLSRVRLSATTWTVAHQAPLSMGFSRQESWSGLPCPSPEDLPNLVLKFMSVCVSCIVGRFFTHRAT